MADRETCAMRPFRPSDAAALRRLIERTIDVSYGPVYPPRALAFFKQFHSEAKILERHREGEILVLEQDGDLVATGALVGQDILGVFVDPGAQQCGHGKTLMRELEAQARARGLSAVKISASLPSRRFYEGLGYGAFLEREKDVGEGQVLRFWSAKKSLAPVDPPASP